MIIVLCPGASQDFPLLQTWNNMPLRYLQDVLVVTAPGSGAETIPFLKTWVNLPMAIGFTVIYAKVQRLLLSSCLLYTAMLLMSTCCEQQFSKLGAGWLHPYSAGHAVNKWLRYSAGLLAAGQRALHRAAFLRLHPAIHCLLCRLRLHHVPSPRHPPPHRYCSPTPRPGSPPLPCGAKVLS